MGFVIYLIFLILTYLRPIEAFAPELESYRPMVWLSLIALTSGIVGTSLNRSTPKSKAADVKKTSLLLLVLFCASIFISLASKAYLGGAITAILNFSPSAVLFFLTLINVNNIQRLKTTCLAIATCTFILAIASIVSYHTGFMVEQLVLKQSSEAPVTPEADALESDIPALDKSGKYLWRVRSMGFLTDPNDFGQAVVMAVPLLFGGFVVAKKMRSIVLIGIPAAAMVYAIYLTHSRGALLGLAALFFFGIKKRFGGIKTALILVALVLASSAAAQLAGGREFSADEESAGGRIDAWSEGLRMLATHPVWGVGYGNFTDFHYYTAHNTFVLCFSELGLVGYFFWMGILVIAFKGLNQMMLVSAKSSDQYRWASVLRTSMLGFLVCACFLSRTYVPNLYILLALCVCASHEDMRPFSPAEPRVMHGLKWARTAALFSISSIFVIFIIVTLKNIGAL